MMTQDAARWYVLTYEDSAEKTGNGTAWICQHDGEDSAKANEEYMTWHGLSQNLRFAASLWRVSWRNGCVCIRAMGRKQNAGRVVSSDFDGPLGDEARNLIWSMETEQTYVTTADRDKPAPF